MTTLTNLRLLAKAASKRDATQIDLDRYYYATSPATILRLLELLDEMGEDLESVEVDFFSLRHYRELMK